MLLFCFQSFLPLKECWGTPYIWGYTWKRNTLDKYICICMMEEITVLTLSNLFSFFISIFKSGILWSLQTWPKLSLSANKNLNQCNWLKIKKKKKLNQTKFKQCHSAIQVSKDLLLNLLKVDHLLQRCEWVGAASSELKSSWKRLKKEKLLKGTLLRNSFLVSIASAQKALMRTMLLTKKIQTMSQIVLTHWIQL